MKKLWADNYSDKIVFLFSYEPKHVPAVFEGSEELAYTCPIESPTRIVFAEETQGYTYTSLCLFGLGSSLSLSKHIFSESGAIFAYLFAINNLSEVISEEYAEIALSDEEMRNLVNLDSRPQ